MIMRLIDTAKAPRTERSTRNAVDIFSKLQVFAKEPIRVQEIKLVVWIACKYFVHFEIQHKLPSKMKTHFSAQYYNQNYICTKYFLWISPTEIEL